MFKIIRRFAFSVLVAHWIYAEINLVWPGARPALDAVLSRIEIPTHDTWPQKWESFKKARGEFVTTSTNASAKQWDTGTFVGIN